MSLWSTYRRGAGWLLVGGLLAFALLHLIVRGPVDNKGDFNLCDFASPWASARLWLIGENPYVIDRLWDTWISSRGSFETERSFWLALLPPGAWVVLSPLAALPAGVAAAFWGIISIASIAAMLASVMALAHIRPGSLTGWLLIALSVASAPIQTLLAVGQVSLPVIALILLAIWFARDGRNIAAGIFLGVAAALKPQLALPFFAWFLFFARWKVLGVASAACILITLVGIIPMELRGHAWLAEYSSNVALSNQPGAPNDPGPTNKWRNQMIDLRFMLSTLFHQRELVVVKGLIISMLLGTAYVVMLVRMRNGNEKGKLLPLATLCALILLPVYHRMYDAALMLPALAWAMTALNGPRRRAALATLAVLSIFLIPWGTLDILTDRTNLLDAVSHTWFYRVIIFPHHALATVATVVCLMWAMWSKSREFASIHAEEVAPPKPPVARQREAELADLASS